MTSYQLERKTVSFSQVMSAIFMIVFLSPHLMIFYFLDKTNPPIVTLSLFLYGLFILYIIGVNLITFVKLLSFNEKIEVQFNSLEGVFTVLENEYIKGSFSRDDVKVFVITEKYNYGAIHRDISVVMKDSSIKSLVEINPMNNGCLDLEEVSEIINSLNKYLKLGI